MTGAARRAANAVFQRLIEVWPRSLQRGREAEDDPRQQRNRESEAERAHVHRDISGARQLRRAERDQQINSPDREQQSGGAAQAREQQTLGEQLPDESEASGAERGAN